MAKYRLKRKTFGIAQSTLNGVGSAIKTTVGGVLEGAGKAAETKTAGVIGGLAAMGKGAAIGSAILPVGGTILGGIGGYLAGKAMMKGAGRAVKNVGQDLQM